MKQSDMDGFGLLMAATHSLAKDVTHRLAEGDMEMTPELTRALLVIATHVEYAQKLANYVADAEGIRSAFVREGEENGV